jgi:hypothetical protein
LAEADEENLRDEATKTHASRGEQEGEATQSMEVAVAALHCGAGCVLGDMIDTWNRVSILYNRADARLVLSRRAACRRASRHDIYKHVRDWNVWLDGFELFCFVSVTASRADRNCVLVHDANSDDHRISDVVSRKSMVVKQSVERENAATHNCQEG